MKREAPLTHVEVFYRDGGAFNFTVKGTPDEVVDALREADDFLVFPTEAGLIAINVKLLIHMECRKGEEVTNNE